MPSPVPAVAVGPVEELLAAYHGHLLLDRGLAEMTIYHYCERAARVFLEDRSEQTSGVLALERLTAGDVTGFLARECLRRPVAMARDLVTRLRDFVRYLHLTGVIEVAWVWAVPGVADQRDPTLPRDTPPRPLNTRWLRSRLTVQQSGGYGPECRWRARSSRLAHGAGSLIGERRRNGGARPLCTLRSAS